MDCDFTFLHFLAENNGLFTSLRGLRRFLETTNESCFK